MNQGERMFIRANEPGLSKTQSQPIHPGQVLPTECLALGNGVELNLIPGVAESTEHLRVMVLASHRNPL